MVIHNFKEHVGMSWCKVKHKMREIILTVNFLECIIYLNYDPKKMQ